MRIVMVGTGYVGLVSGACFAEFGHEVTCVDRDEDKIARLRAGEIPIYEPGLAELVRADVQQNRLAFSTDLPKSIQDADVVFIAVGTPPRAGDGHADLSCIHAAAAEIAAAVTRPLVIVMKSTVPVGTGDDVERVFRRVRPDLSIPVVSNPEFLREGAAIRDFKLPDRIVVGTDNPEARDVMDDVYRPLYMSATPIIYTTRRTAELIKYAANAFLATKISFINEIADLCEAVGANVQDVARGIGSDNRIGPKFLHAGPGFGGSCFPKDTMALVRMAQDHQTTLRVVEATISVNDQRKRNMVHRVAAVLDGVLRERTVAVLGLTFKPNTDDMRSAPSLALISALKDHGAHVRVYDPVGMEQAQRSLPEVTYCADAYAAARNSDAVVIVTEWEQFRALDLKRLKRIMARPAIVDLRNVYRPEQLAKAGFVYECIGYRRPRAPLNNAEPVRDKREKVSVLRPTKDRVAARSTHVHPAECDGRRYPSVEDARRTHSNGAQPGMGDA